MTARRRPFRSLLAVSLLALAAAGAGLAAAPAAAQEPLRIEITEGVIEPMPIALPAFAADGGSASYAQEIRQVVSDDLAGSGLFRIVDPSAYLVPGGPVDARPDFENWRVINAEALGVAESSLAEDGRLQVRFQLWDVFGGKPLGDGLGLRAAPGDARRIGHKIADAIHLALTGEPGYFDSRVAFISETGPKNARQKRVAIMDQDGANVRYITDGSSLALSPQFSPSGDSLVYISWGTGAPKVVYQDLRGGGSEVLGSFPSMSFSPKFSPDGSRVLMSLTDGANTDIYSMSLASRQLSKLTSGPGIETSPDYSPDGSEIVFESDAGGTQQLYVMPANGGAPRRISFGEGRYGTPVWSPRGDLIAFTKQLGGRFHVGVMRTDGSNERLLTASFLDEGPTWSPNGRVLMFFRESPGAQGAPQIWRVDANGRNLRRAPTPGAASDPSWSPLLP
ncbi:Tol-Pal system beta propeller repeat protein TolB [Albimonas sp. CAU 1670]|uniref:Tol-Pal system beta propeller repeat protein TolB n=1 Tax=Albimonas sp. CAU 1670 TaxID=3032599 RepID=UPI0023DAF5D6|nr:Tol-Pal system beta propeller repeat protein TolB [Albimonas sp. CAU 1670]MDF2233558.1 Tol-Pal system beta propeller repeat protein TolB [Albimonas sp. CAU 1670]